MAKQTESQKKNHFKKNSKKPEKSGRQKGTRNQKTVLKAVGAALLGTTDFKDLPDAWVKIAGDLYKGATSWDKKAKIFEILGKALPKNVDVTSKGEKVNEPPAVVQRIYQIPAQKQRPEDEDNFTDSSNDN